MRISDWSSDVCSSDLLCRTQLDNFKMAIADGRPTLVACTQEAPLFEETGAEENPDAVVRYTNIRERAGWSEQGERALPKIAALLAEEIGRASGRESVCQ